MLIKSSEFFLATIDPLHIGSGSIHLGKVDNPIVLDPATRLPKIPGTGILGAVKYYIDLWAIHMMQEIGNSFYIGKRNAKKDETVWCASTKGTCGDDCLICYTFGYSKDSDSNGGNKSSKGVISFCDANLVLFPVYSSMYGQVWITSDRIYNKHFKGTDLKLKKNKIIKSESLPSSPIGNKIEIGGVIFEVEEQKLDTSAFTKIFNDIGYNGMENKVLVISDDKFAAIVRKNLEHRTSIAIDPETGATKDGALFTFEAVPANSIFLFQANMNDYKKRNSPFEKNTPKYDSAKEKIKEIINSNEKNNIINKITPLDFIKIGFYGIKDFGMGGMNTRGFGRLNFIGKGV